ncbi:TetR/AcrR family transcriptional regulator [Thalassospira xiamenensis]|uniref:Transcriptional regulator, TetR family n=1 Tax=Thalassospira xiamenensis TaxID=220697 RepID=A0A285TJB6_9PROT|nr:TetR family transcriptional regulator C-terminal domain-containing protein [Thalassospira xiamenensis]SOC20816.1 transcriptional regulator, TetR family [Thalassospira xiamenensis]
MPKIVNHDKRRGEIIDALIRLAACTGLHMITMRAVATEADVSLRLVQYYFTDKAGLMHAALRKLETDSHQRWAERLSGDSTTDNSRKILESFITEAIPDDRQSRTFHLVWLSYAMIAMTDAFMASHPFAEGPKRLERQLYDLFVKCQLDGSLPVEADPAFEATRLITLVHGLGTSVMIDHLDASSAIATAHRHLETVFTPETARI